MRLVVGCSIHHKLLPFKDIRLDMGRTKKSIHVRIYIICTSWCLRIHANIKKIASTDAKEKKVKKFSVAPYSSHTVLFHPSISFQLHPSRSYLFGWEHLFLKVYLWHTVAPLSHTSP